MIEEIKITSNKKEEFIKVTDKINAKIKESSYQRGVVHIFLPHTTAGITINDKITAVTRDILVALDKVYPEDGDYIHNACNSPAHIKASLMGSSVSILFNEGKLLLGDWQEIYFCEFDGPKNKRMYVNIIEN